MASLFYTTLWIDVAWKILLVYNISLPSLTNRCSQNDANNILQVRNYKSLSAECKKDGNSDYYYMLNRTVLNTTAVYNGKLRCKDSACTNDCMDIVDLPEAQCGTSRDWNNPDFRVQ